MPQNRGKCLRAYPLTFVPSNCAAHWKGGRNQLCITPPLADSFSLQINDVITGNHPCRCFSLWRRFGGDKMRLENPPPPPPPARKCEAAGTCGSPVTTCARNSEVCASNLISWHPPRVVEQHLSPCLNLGRPWHGLRTPTCAQPFLRPVGKTRAHCLDCYWVGSFDFSVFLAKSRGQTHETHNKLTTFCRGDPGQGASSATSGERGHGPCLVG